MACEQSRPSMSEPRAKSRLEMAVRVFFALGFISVAVPLVVTPIAVLRLSGAIHGHPIFGWALSFYSSSLVPGLVSLIGIWRLGRYGLLWLPLVGLSLNGALAFLAFGFWALSGINIQ